MSASTTQQGGAGATAAAPAERTKSILKASAGPEEIKQGSQMPTFRVDLKYRNTLPPVPFDPSFLEIPFPSDFLWGFRHSSLEKSYKYRIHMNPPQLIDDMIDPLGAEEWAKAIKLDEKDKVLTQKKEGVDAKATANNLRANREAKTWMLKTIYTRENIHRPSSAGPSQESLEASTFVVQDESQESRAQLIREQFEIANSDETPPAPPGKQVKRVLPLLPSRTLREVFIHLLRYKVGERVLREDIPEEKNDSWVTNHAILIHRRNELDEEEDGGKPQNEYSPLSLFLPKSVSSSRKKGGDDEEDLFADEEEDLFADEEEPSSSAVTTATGTSFDKKHVEYIREYQVQQVTAKNANDRIALLFDEDAVRYVELEPDSLRLFRIKRSADDDWREAESNLELTLRLDASKEEKKQRAKRRRTIEGGELSLGLSQGSSNYHSAS